MNDGTPIPPESLREHAGFVRSLALGLLRDEHLADDVVQETWIAALEHPPRDHGRLRAWFASVARRFALRTLRSGRRRSYREQATARSESLPSAGDLVARESALRGVTEAVLALDENSRDMVLLHYYEGLSARQIAERRGEPLATVRSRLQRSLERLRATLDASHGGDRSTWCLGLACLFGSDRLIQAAAAGGAATAATVTTTALGPMATTGVLVMSAKLKIAGAVGVVALIGLAGWKLTEPYGVEVEPSEPRTSASAVLDAPEDLPLVANQDVESRVEATGISEASAPIEDARFGALTLHASWHPSGDPAPGRMFEIIQWDAPAALRKIMMRTDENGDLLVEGIYPGTVTVYGDVGGHGSAEIAAGEDAHIDSVIKRTYAVRGVVVDPDGNPVPNADVWLSDYFNYHQGNIYTTTGPDGSYLIESAGEARYLSARAPGWAPAHQVFISDRRTLLEEGEEVEIELVLTGRGARVVGTVYLPDGKPAAGAHVDLADPTSQPVEIDGEMDTVFFPPHILRTDENGMFVAEGAPLRTLDLHIKALGAAPYTDQFLLQEEGANLTITLHPEGIVTGIVLDDTGSPVAGVKVHHAIKYGFDRPSGESDQEGRYRIEGLPTGHVKLAANSDEHGSAETTVIIALGEPVEWSPRLDPGRVLRGQLVDENGDPLAGWHVACHSPIGGPRGRWDEGETTDKEGRFAVLSCPEGTLTIKLRPDPMKATYVATHYLRATGEEYRLVVGSDMLPTARIRGVVLDPDGKGIFATLTPWLQGENRASVYEGDKDTGAFETELLVPGRYTITLSPLDYPDYAYGEVVLAPNQELDIGTIRLETPGSARIDVSGEQEEGEHNFLQFNISRADVAGIPLGKGIAFLDEEDLADSTALLPGDYALLIYGNNVAQDIVPFRVNAGDETVVSVELAKGQNVSVELKLPEGEPLPGILTVELEDESGRRLDRSLLQPFSGRFNAGYCLGKGTYRLRASAESGLAGVLDFDVDLAGEPATHTLRLE